MNKENANYNQLANVSVRLHAKMSQPDPLVGPPVGSLGDPVCWRYTSRSEPGTVLSTQHLDETLLEVNTLISRDERVSSNPVARIVFGDPADFLPHLPRKSVVHSSKMWSCRRKVTVEHLWHLVEQRNGKETMPILWKFLQKVRPPRVTAGPTSPGDLRAPALTWPGDS